MKINQLIILLISLFSIRPANAQEVLEVNSTSALYSINLDNGSRVFSDFKFGLRIKSGIVLQSNEVRYKHKISTISVIPKEFKNAVAKQIYCKDKKGAIDLICEIVFLGNNQLALRTGIVNRTDSSLFLESVQLIKSKIACEGATNILSVGSAVFPLIYGLPQNSSFAIGLDKPSIAAGALTGEHSLINFEVLKSGNSIDFSATGSFDGCKFLPDEKRYSDWIYISTEKNSMNGLEQFADLAAKINNAQPWKHNFACLCTWYSGLWFTDCNEGKLEQFTFNALPNLDVNNKFTDEKWIRVVDDSKLRMAGDWPEKTSSIPNGYTKLAEKVHKSGYKLGYWLDPFDVQVESDVFKNHKDWLTLNDKGLTHTEIMSGDERYGNIGVLDMSVPLAEQHMVKMGQSFKNWGMDYIMTDFTDYGYRGGKLLHDPTMTGLEHIRKGYKAFRSGLGPDIYWMGNMISQAAMGLVNGKRTGTDQWGEDFAGYYQASTEWFTNHRLWVCDPDAYHYGRQPVSWERAWASWVALAGYNVTYDFTYIDKQPMDPVLLETFKRLMPPMDVIGRPIDIFENQPNLCWDLPLLQGDESYHVIGIFNWMVSVNRKVEVNLDHIFGLMPNDKTNNLYLIYNFWDNQFVGISDGVLELPLPEKAAQVYCIKRFTGKPQILATSSHISQGFMELSNINWNESNQILSGNSKSLPGRSTSLAFYIPPSHLLTGFEIDGKPVHTSKLANGTVVGDYPLKGGTAQSLPANGVYIVDLEDQENTVAWQISTSRIGEDVIPKQHFVKDGNCINKINPPSILPDFIDILRKAETDRFKEIERDSWKVYAYMNCNYHTDIPYSAGIGYGYEAGKGDRWWGAWKGLPLYAEFYRAGNVVRYRVDGILKDKDYRIGFMFLETFNKGLAGRKLKMILKNAITDEILFEKSNYQAQQITEEAGFKDSLVLNWIDFKPIQDISGGLVIEFVGLPTEKDPEIRDATISEIWVLEK